MNIKACMINLLGPSNRDQVELVLDRMMQVQQRAGCNEFIVGIKKNSINLAPLRAGYEVFELPWLRESQLYTVCVKGNQAEAHDLADPAKALGRLPKLPAAANGATAIVNAVNRIMQFRVLEAHEPPWPKNSPAHWGLWANYCVQGHFPTLGGWLKIAISRLDEATKTNAA